MEKIQFRVKVKSLYTLPEERMVDLRDRIIDKQEIDNGCVGYAVVDVTGLEDQLSLFGDSLETKELYFPIYVEKVESKYRYGSYHILNPVTGDFIQKSPVETELRLIPFILHGIMKKPDEEIYSCIAPAIGDDQEEIYASMIYYIGDDGFEMCFLRAEISSEIIMTEDPYYAILLIDEEYDGGPAYTDLFRVYLGSVTTDDEAPKKEEEVPLQRPNVSFM